MLEDSRSLNVVIGIALTVVVVGACARGDVTPTVPPVKAPAEEPLETPTTVQPTLAPAPPPPVALPVGQVPDILVGTWSGGEGAKTGEILAIGEDGSYARVDRKGLTYRKGVIVAAGTNFVTYDLDGQQESGSWTYSESGGIEVLGVYFGPYYYSYTRS